MLSIILFADDTDLFFSHKSVNTLQQTRNQGIKKVASWLSANKLNSLHVKKKYIYIYIWIKREENESKHHIQNKGTTY